jgi:uncharacterized membrane protein HdeD (DUF308 family)
VSVPGNMTSETKSGGGTGTFMANLIPLLGLFVIGYPLAQATVRTMLIGWILIAMAIVRFIFWRSFQTMSSAVLIRTTPARSTDCGHHR